MYHAVFTTIVSAIIGLICNKIEKSKRPNQLQTPYFRFIHYGATLYHGDDCQGEMDSGGPRVEFGCTDTCFSSDGSRSVFIEARWYYVLWQKDEQYQHVDTEGPVVDAYSYECDRPNFVVRARVPRGSEKTCFNFNQTIYNFELKFLLECHSRERPLDAPPLSPGEYYDWYSETNGHPNWAVEESGASTVANEMAPHGFPVPDSTPDSLREALAHGGLPEADDDDDDWDWEEDDEEEDDNDDDHIFEEVEGEDPASMTSDERRRYMERKCKAKCFKKAKKVAKKKGAERGNKKEAGCRKRCETKARRPAKEDMIFPAGLSKGWGD